LLKLKQKIFSSLVRWRSCRIFRLLYCSNWYY